MRNTTFISSMVLSVACVSAANATVVYNTIDPFTTSASTSSPYGYVYSALTGTLWGEGGIKTTTSSFARATTTLMVNTSSSSGSGNIRFNITQAGMPNTDTGTNQKAYLDYFTPTGSGLYPDFTNFTSLDFNFASTLSGSGTAGTTGATGAAGTTLKCIIRLSNAANFAVEKTMSGSSGLMSFTLADFGGITMNIEAMGPLSIEFIRSGSNASGSLTITNLVAQGASVPAPGAIALLGAAGLVGARRRRA